MTLIIDCFKLVKGQGKSIGIYNHAKNVVTNLAKENNSVKKIDKIVILGNEKNCDDFSVEGVTLISIPYNPLSKLQSIMWELFWVKSYIKKYNGDRVLFPRGYAPLYFRGRDTVIIHDLIPFYYHENFPGVFNPLENFYIMNRLKGSIKRAERVITISEYSKKEIEKRVPSAKEKINVIYNGFNKLTSTAEKEDTMQGEYIVAMTSGLPHKNAKGVMEAYKQYFMQAENPLPIKVIGISGTEGYDMGEAARQVTCYPYVKDDKELSKMISGGKLFLFLSLIEGFGFPPLEAMQLKVPVICSDRTSLPEVVGDAALLVNPENAKEVAEKIEQLLSDVTLQNELKQAGINNCSRFSWEKIVKEYMEELAR